MARVYAIASAKGGVGKTTTTANLGSTLADTGAAVVVIDGDIGMANLGAALGVSPDGPTLHDVLAGEVEPQRAAYDGPAGLTVIPGDTSLDSFAAADPQRLERVVDAFDDADFILIDVGAGVSHETSIPLSVADSVVLVSTAERDALVDTEKTRQLTERLDGVVAGAVITRTDDATPIEEVVGGTLTANVLATIPDDEAVRESIAVGEPLVSYAPHSEAAAGYRELARKLTGRTPSQPEPSPTELAAETREVLEESGSQLSDSLSDSVTMEPDGEPASEQQDTTDTTDTKHTDQIPTETAQTETDSDDDHNVVNPFAAKPEESPEDVDQPDQQIEQSTDQLTDQETEHLDPQEESKWADAATGTGVDESTTPETPDLNPDPGPNSDSESGEGESVPPDAIPFGSSDTDEADEDTGETTVLGDAIEADSQTAGEDDGESTAAESDADDQLIPDAEGRDIDDDSDEPSEAEISVDEPSEAEISVDEPDEPDDSDDDKKRGFFSRLFR